MFEQVLIVIGCVLGCLILFGAPLALIICLCVYLVRKSKYFKENTRNDNEKNKRS